MSLTKETILAADDLPRQEVLVPEWGGSVWVRTMTAGERDAWELSGMKGDTFRRENIRARLAVVTVTDEQGALLFGETDIDALGKKSAAALDRVMGVAMKLNGLSKDDVEDLVGNSEPGQSDGSSSA